MGDPLPSPTKSPVEQRVDALEARVGALERRLQALVLADIRLRPIGGIGGGGDGGSSIGPDLHDVLQQMHNKGISPRG
jgi:hypothetical protein